jgi:hypothetical protein
MSTVLRHFVIPLPNHEAIVGALELCAMINNDNRAVVMVLGYGDDWEEFTGVYLGDYERECLDDPDTFACYEQHQLWISVPEGGAA